LSFQDDAFEDHSHAIIDLGHRHQDTGQTHNYEDCGVYDFIVGFAGQISFNDNRECPMKTTQTGYAEITTDKTSITISSALGAKTGTETRPKNMAVQWIIRVF
jgi:hypothetical protein